MRVLIAPDSFKGSLTATQAAKAMACGLARVFPEAEAELLPVADGGEGTSEILAAATGGRLVSHSARDPLGRQVQAFFGLSGDGRTAFVESAAASGLGLLAPGERNPLIASSYGTGDLVRAALKALHDTKGDGPRQLILGLGGSATNDGGAGALAALGVRLLDEGGQELAPGGAALAHLAAMDLSGLDPLLWQTDILLASDVNAPLLGPQGASAVFGPQKGATPQAVRQLDDALGRYALVAHAATGIDAAVLPGSGAAGGLAAAFLYCTRARLRPGVELVLETAGFSERAAGADLVLTGEGRADGQTTQGKAPLGVARAAKVHARPVVCIAGILGEGAEALYAHGVDVLAACITDFTEPDKAMRDAGPRLQATTEQVMRAVRLGMCFPDTSKEL
ncbi:glycerate kinase [Desulfovibrio sp. OttesenSCG-928-F20]|nr:glycerate kinase [Desulfovibrio sp. OttesenSCG-928-M16]MDL2290653.1 glycerate kinase [Desulfovibrio sp. OttesenSCG-928-F20]